MNNITVITDDFIKLDTLYAVKLFIKSLFKKKKHTGHYAVTRSLCAGLDLLNVKYNYNPPFTFLVNKNVIVLSNIDVLKKCIELKQHRKIRKLLAGPNLMVRSNEYNCILGDKHIDKVIVPSEWVKRAYIEDLQILENRIEIWAAGIDEFFFTPNSNLKDKTIIIYWKTESKEFIDQICNLVILNGFNVEIINYGAYELSDFKIKLQHAIAVIYVSICESQGLAIQEIWSMNIPTFVWQPNSLIIGEKMYREFSSSPYLCSETGVFFHNLTDLEIVLNRFKDNKYTFNPRKIVVENYTDLVCAQKLLNLL